MGRRICLVGFSELSRTWANEQPDDVEIWGLNESHHFLKRCDRFFQIHPRNWNSEKVNSKGFTFSGHCQSCGWEKTGKPDDSKSVELVKRLAQEHFNANPDHEVEYGQERFRDGDYGRTPHHIRVLARCGVPVHMQNVDERIPTSVRVPYEEITELLGLPDINGRKRLYLTSTVAWMMAVALYEHKGGQTISEIRLAGIEMSIGTEYARQKPCLEWWLGLAMGMGIEVKVAPTGSSILSDAIYAIDHLAPLAIPEEMVARVAVTPDDNRPYVAIAQDQNGSPIGFMALP